MYEPVKNVKAQLALIKEHKQKGRKLYHQYFKYKETLEQFVEKRRGKSDYELVKEMANIDDSEIFPSKRD
jgi:molybdenum-dependent DNA-binding transcriptional regulator ModE